MSNHVSEKPRLVPLVAVVAVLIVAMCCTVIAGETKLASERPLSVTQTEPQMILVIPREMVVENADANEPNEIRLTTLEYREPEVALIVEHPVYSEKPKMTEITNDPEDVISPEHEKLYSEDDVIALAKMSYGESWCTGSDTEMTACMWVALNRYDSGDAYYADCDSVADVVTQPNQFHGYDADHPVEPRLEALARDVLERWSAEKRGAEDVGRTLPPEYCYFWGDGVKNHFCTEWQGGDVYDWSLESPYDN